MKESIKTCKVCFEPINNNNIYYLINSDASLCSNCYKKLKPIFLHFKIDDVPGLAIYEYDENIKGLLYQFKGCYDIELRKIFFDRYVKGLSLYYYGYYIVPTPSYEQDDILREFNHVLEMFSALKLKWLPIVRKVEKYKQSSHTAEERKEISKFLKLTSFDSLNDKKILIVDDVCTTGSTITAMIELLKPLHPKKIKILVMSKRILRKNESENVEGKNSKN